MAQPAGLAQTLGELKQSGFTEVVSVKEEMRRNLVRKLRNGESLFPGIVGYDETVIPQVTNAILAHHDFLLLGLRGQAKTRLVRALVSLLDDYVPYVAGSPVHDHPLAPITRYASNLISELGDATPIAWLPREARYQEKLATPDVTIADLIGDIDPVKAVAKKLDFSDEEVIHYGIIPRSNRGIFAINELPDLQPRIQVGLLNIMEERDIQIRGFPVRLALDLCIVYTANPEDYTNRGNIITPLKDRIDAQIITHYPESLHDAVSITAQEAWVDRSESKSGVEVSLPTQVRELVELTAFEARQSDYVDKNSGVSARMSITLLETVVSNAERRALVTGSSVATARVSDLVAALSAITGKLELVYKGEQEGPQGVAHHIVGRAVRDMFNKKYVPNWKPGRETKFKFPQFQAIVGWFESENTLEITDSMSDKDFLKNLRAIDGLEALAQQDFAPKTEGELGAAMELIVEGLAQNFLLTKMIIRGKTVYADTVSHMMGQMDD